MRLFLFLLPASLSLATPGSVVAEVAASSEAGFVSHNEVLVPVSPEQAWAVLIRPSQWWNSSHTYSGDAANMTMNAAAGGCFCERVPGKGAPDGEIEHMRVVYISPYSALRLSGGLGPLQSEAVSGVLTVTLKPEGQGTRIAFDYAVGGYMRPSMTEMAPVADGVVGEQLQRLGERLGKTG
ncbi:SRPBCC family protein [Croceibacterium sp. LX-88]|uniref:SRPBCC family protein n=1 Tax=Croceibacterium selenioxidans TaxID=2838833 RepID=A0ABS5W1Y0_9SPHN|nr:SRPBCC family protein [Croceibacterium selenioxidans]MBT2133342.1 SRPBCC family protein [Croceibacterium selenioxidans]